MGVEVGSEGGGEVFVGGFVERADEVDEGGGIGRFLVGFGREGERGVEGWVGAGVVEPVFGVPFVVVEEA